MKLHKTGHHIADTVSDLIGDLDGDCTVAYGILRHERFTDDVRWFEVDRGFWDASHFGGNYRISYRGTQPKYDPSAPKEDHGLVLEPWKPIRGDALICPPSEHVIKFFKIDIDLWMKKALYVADKMSLYPVVRTKSNKEINWNDIGAVITYNSTLGIEALRRGITVISDPVNSSIGSYCVHKKTVVNYDRNQLLSFCAGHQFKLNEKQKIAKIIEHYDTKDLHRT